MGEMQEVPEGWLSISDVVEQTGLSAVYVYERMRNWALPIEKVNGKIGLTQEGMERLTILQPLASHPYSVTMKLLSILNQLASSEGQQRFERMNGVLLLTDPFLMLTPELQGIMDQILKGRKSITPEDVERIIRHLSAI